MSREPRSPADLRLRAAPPARARRGFLSPYRAVDLTDHRGVLAGHMMAQLGMDVIQVEPPEGCSARRQPPFAPSWPEPENSFYWSAFGAGKRSLACDPATPAGLAILRQLLVSADFLLESAAPADGRPEWLDPAFTLALNPRLIHVTVTPFGLTGPKANWADSEITLWAACGPMLLTRGLDDQPLRMSVPQAYHHAAADAVSGALMAHFARLASGRGQHVDVSVHQALPQSTLSAVLAAAVSHADFTPRPKPPGETTAQTLDLSGSGSLTRRSKWAVEDGLAELHLGMGPAAGPGTNALFAWMRAEGALDARFFDWDWSSIHSRVRAGEVSEADLEAARANVARFLETRRKSELVDVAIRYGVRIAPIQTVGDLLASPHEAARGFFEELKGPFGEYRLPGAFAQGLPQGFVDLTSAPRLGEHTTCILAELAGLSLEEVDA